MEHSEPDSSAAEPLSPLRSVHTSNFPQLLSTLNCSLAVTTYQANRLILLRSEGERINTHFRYFQQPMGIAHGRDRFAVGSKREITEFRNVPAVANKIDDKRTPDACYMPRSIHFTGDIQIHEMDWGIDDSGADAQPTLWFVNTRFSCLCVRGSDYTFVPRWRPKFISAIAPQDRCHLNGLCMENQRPKFVSALGETDAPAGWRDNKATGGILIDVDSNEIVARGLSMPHSPRLFNQQLWVLNSGDGGIGIIEPQSGKYQPVATLPGFTRGFAIYDRYAFIGLSQVRESAIFSGIAIAQRPEEERWSGVAVVDLITGEPVAWLRFEDAVQEVFAINVLPNEVWPDLINEDEALLNYTFVLPEEALLDVPDDMRSCS